MNVGERRKAFFRPIDGVGKTAAPATHAAATIVRRVSASRDYHTAPGIIEEEAVPGAEGMYL